MTFQSSFLIRHWLSSGADPAQAKAYSIQHVQSGAEFRSINLSEVVQWMTDQNIRYVREMLEKHANASDNSEDRQ